jgi:hypothetical protein
MNTTPTLTLPLKGGGEGGGEYVKEYCDVSIQQVFPEAR